MYAQLEKMRVQLEASIASLCQEVPPGDHEEWAEEMARSRVCDITERSFEQVVAEHGLYSDELLERVKGTRVLIIGPGNSDFGAKLLEASPGTSVTSVDVDEQALEGQPGMRVTASADELPLDDNCVDQIFMTYSIPLWAKSAKQVAKSLDEAVRVLAPGGTLYITPLAQARLRIAATRQADGHVKTLGIEPDPRFGVVLREIDTASIEWVQGALANSDHDVELVGSKRYGDDFGGILGVTITRHSDR